MVILPHLRKALKEKYGNHTEIDLIILDVLKIDKAKLFFDIPVDDTQFRDIENKVIRLEKGEPVEYITGHKEFMSLDFIVNSSTLIPRADTETLVEEIIRLYSRTPVNMFEIGTGSGCIAVSLAYYLQKSKIVACDISEAALETAKKNAVLNRVDDRIEFIKHDILSGFPDLEFVPDCVISNPPYIESGIIPTLDKKVRAFEPISALDGGEDGLKFYREIINSSVLKQNGVLAFEIGYNQGQVVSEMMKDKFYDIKIIKDMSGNDRVVSGIKL